MLQVKVTFKDEPGEGSGVARSFYTAIADAFLTMQSLPSETYVATAFGPSPDTNSSGIIYFRAYLSFCCFFPFSSFLYSMPKIILHCAKDYRFAIA